MLCWAPANANGVTSPAAGELPLGLLVKESLGMVLALQLQLRASSRWARS